MMLRADRSVRQSQTIIHCDSQHFFLDLAGPAGFNYIQKKVVLGLLFSIFSGRPDLIN